MIDIILLSICYFINSALLVRAFSMLVNTKVVRSVSLVFKLLFYMLSMLVINLVLKEFMQLFFLFILSLYIFYKVFRMSFKENLFYTIIIFLISDLIYLPLSFILSSIFKFYRLTFINLNILQIVLSIVYSLVIILSINSKEKTFIDKIKTIFYHNNFFYIISLIVLISVDLLKQFLLSQSFIIQVILLETFSLVETILFIILFSKLLMERIDYEQGMNDYDDLSSKYTKMNDEYRILRHNLVNDLLAVKSCDEKRYRSLIDVIIKKYRRNYELYIPVDNNKTGIASLIDMKIQVARKYRVNMEMHTTIDLENFNDLEATKYLKICEVLGIAIDNAIEAAKVSKEKIVDVEIYENNGIIFEIANSFCSTIDLEKLFDSEYSTKNRGTGIGLNYIASLKSAGIKTSVEIRSNFFILRIFV